MNTSETATPVISGTLSLAPHPEYPGSVLGHINRTPVTAGTQAQVSGDLMAGTFNLDESADGVNVDAVWVGEATAQACGREIRGMRLPVEGRPNAGDPMRFVLTKAAWH